jgi:hypothetical protein
MNLPMKEPHLKLVTQEQNPPHLSELMKTHKEKKDLEINPASKDVPCSTKIVSSEETFPTNLLFAMKIDLSMLTTISTLEYSLFN